MLGKIEGRGRSGHQDEVAGLHHRCNGHELGETLGDGEGHGGLACWSMGSGRIGHDWVSQQQQQGVGQS